MLASQGLIDVGRIRRGQSLLLNGAGGGVGTFALQIAKLYDAEITVVDHAGKLDMLRALGAHHAIDYRTEDFTRTGKRYDLILDTRSTRSPFAYARALKPGGAYVTVGGDTSRLLQLAMPGWVVARLIRHSPDPCRAEAEQGSRLLQRAFRGRCARAGDRWRVSSGERARGAPALRHRRSSRQDHRLDGVPLGWRRRFRGHGEVQEDTERTQNMARRISIASVAAIATRARVGNAEFWRKRRRHMPCFYCGHGPRLSGHRIGDRLRH